MEDAAPEWAPGTPMAEMAETCILIRAFEERLLQLFSQGHVSGTTHTSIGQEVNAVGILANCRPSDTIVSNHRCHAHFIAGVGQIDRLMAEILGLPNGVCGGIGGSQHLCVPGRFYSNGIQGGIAPFALGLAIAKSRRGEEGVVVVFLGDGTLGQGVVYETLNMARLLNARLLFVVEDNGIAQSTDTSRTTAGSIAARFQAFDIPAVSLEYPDLQEISQVSADLLSAIRGDAGPAALIIKSVRLGPHSKGDDTRSADELAAMREKDAFSRLSESLGAARYDLLCSSAADHVARIAADLLEQRAALARAELIAEPDYSSSADPVLIEEGYPQRQNERLRNGIARLLAADAAAIFMGEDILSPYGGAFKVAGDLSVRFPEQVFSTPISEAAICGVAGGLSVGGCLPIVELMFGDFTALAADQIINHFAKFRQMYAGQVRTPGIIRTPMGGRRGYGPTHSQSLEKHFLGVPGLYVVAPSILHPVEDMLAGCAVAEYPTLFIENKLDYARSAAFETAAYRGFRVRSRGSRQAPTLALSLTDFEDDRFTLITYGGMLHICIDALERLAIEHELTGRLVCVSALSPLPIADIELECCGSLAVIAEEGGLEFGWGAEVSSRLSERSTPYKIIRMGAKAYCIPAATALEAELLPSADAIVQAALEALYPQ